MPDPLRVEAQTRAWIDAFVVELELCPFAAASLERGGLAVEVAAGRDPEAVAHAWIDLLQRLQEPAATHLESCLLVVPEGLDDFTAFNAFLAIAEGLLEDLGLCGVFQLASFHPDYRFAQVPADDPANFSNRSPYPMLHVLRESAVEHAVASHPDAEGIPGRNVARLRELGRRELEARRSALLQGEHDA